MLAQYGIQSKLSCIVTDSAANEVAATGKQGRRCTAHQFHLIVKNAALETKDCATLIKNLSSIVSSTKNHRNVRAIFAGYQQDCLNDKDQYPDYKIRKLILWCETRWGLAYSMMECALSQRAPLESLLEWYSKESAKKANKNLEKLAELTTDDWDLMEDMVLVLKKITQYTTTLEGSQFVSVSLVLALFYQLQAELKALDVKLLKTEAGKELYKKVLEGCTNRGAQILDDHVFVATFCDPRFKWLSKEILDTSDSHKTLSQMLLARMTAIQTQIQAEESKSKMAQQALQSVPVNAPVPPSSTAGLGLLERFKKHQEKSSVQENMVTVACLALHARGRIPLSIFYHYVLDA